MLNLVPEKGTSHPHNLPVQMTSLIGRSQEITAASALLQQTDRRLLTLTGPGGSGKTRLALAVAEALLPQFKDGVFFVSLASLHEPELVLASIARILNIEEVAGQPLLQRLRDVLQERHLLLVLDNFEHVLEAGPLIADLLATAPQLKVLVTSREILHIYGEYEFVVLPLTLPLELSQISTEAVTQFTAITLFIERAQAIKPGFRLTRENMLALTEICIRLDGLPLAIELAAARIKLLTPQEILARLQDRFKLLTGGAHNLPLRQRTLRNTLDWSYDLLTENERRFFRRLGVLAGTWTLAAAEAVSMQDVQDEIDALDLLTSLVDKSLVRALEEADGETRFMLLETVREYALDRLIKSGELEATRWWQMQFYLHLAEEAEPHLQEREQRVWLQRLDREAANLWAVLRHVIACNDAVTGLRMAGALINFLQVRSALGEGRNWLEEILSLDIGVQPAGLRAKVLYGAGVQASMRNDLLLARKHLKESTALAATSGERRIQALSSGMLAHLELYQGNYDAAYAYAEAGMQVLNETEDKWCKGILHSIYAKIESKLCNFERARVRYHVGLVLLREVGDLRNQADVMAHLGSTMRLQGQLKTAYFLYSKSLSLFEELDDRWNQLACLNGIGNILRSQGKYTEAQTYFESSLSQATLLGNRQERVVALTGLGQLAIYQENMSQAARYLKESLRLSREIEHTPGIALLLLGSGELERIKGNAADATSYYEQCLALTRTVGDKVTMVSALFGLGDIALTQQNYLHACTLLKQSVHLSWEIGDRPGLAAALEVFAWCCRQLGLPERAVLFLGTAATLRDSLQIPLTPSWNVNHEYEVSMLREAMSKAAFEETWIYGKTMSLKLALSMVARIHMPEQVERKQQPVTYPAGLTPREVDVLRLVATGMTDSLVAEALVLSPRTVNTHLRSIYAKLGVSSRSAATRFAVEQKLI